MGEKIKIGETEFELPFREGDNTGLLVDRKGRYVPGIAIEAPCGLLADALNAYLEKEIPQAVLMSAKSIISRSQETCRWIYNGDEYSYHDTDCGNAHYFEEGDVQENKYRFCPYCGRRIKEIIPKRDDD